MVAAPLGQLAKSIIMVGVRDLKGLYPESPKLLRWHHSGSADDAGRGKGARATGMNVRKEQRASASVFILRYEGHRKREGGILGAVQNVPFLLVEINEMGFPAGWRNPLQANCWPVSHPRHRETSLVVHRYSFLPGHIPGRPCRLPLIPEGTFSLVFGLTAGFPGASSRTRGSRRAIPGGLPGWPRGGPRRSTGARGPCSERKRKN